MTSACPYWYWFLSLEYRCARSRSAVKILFTRPERTTLQCTRPTDPTPVLEEEGGTGERVSHSVPVGTDKRLAGQIGCCESLLKGRSVFDACQLVCKLNSSTQLERWQFASSAHEDVLRIGWRRTSVRACWTSWCSRWVYVAFLPCQGQYGRVRPKSLDFARYLAELSGMDPSGAAHGQLQEARR